MLAWMTVGLVVWLCYRVTNDEPRPWVAVKTLALFIFAGPLALVLLPKRKKGSR